jgi:VanZ family protein
MPTPNADPIHAPLHCRRLWWGIGWALVLLVICFSLAPKAPEVPGDPGNWSGHLIAYGTLGAWFARLLPPSRNRLYATLMLIAMGGLMEVLQGLSGYRTADPLDMLANTSGVLLGMLAAPPRLPNGLLTLDRWLARRPG